MDKRIAEIRKANQKLLIDIIYAIDADDLKKIAAAQQAINIELDKLEKEYGIEYTPQDEANEIDDLDLAAHFAVVNTR